MGGMTLSRLVATLERSLRRGNRSRGIAMLTTYHQKGVSRPGHIVSPRSNAQDHLRIYDED